MSLMKAREGDEIIRNMAGTEMVLYVYQIRGNILWATTGKHKKILDEEHIEVGVDTRPGMDSKQGVCVWCFEMQSGIELDDMIGPLAVSTATCM